MADVTAPDFGSLLAPQLSQIPPAALPRFLALLERAAAQRYRDWAGALPEHADVLLACAAAEDEIADRIEAAVPIDAAVASQIAEPLPAARQAYLDAFSAFDVWDQLRLQADAERQGARAWRNIASRTDDHGLRRRSPRAPRWRRRAPTGSTPSSRALPRADRARGWSCAEHVQASLGRGDRFGLAGA
jgi:hypothetical protein